MVKGKKEKEQDKEKYKNMLSGSIIAFVILLFLPINTFNVFFTPLYDIIPLDSIVLIFFITMGSTLGYIYHKLR